MKNLPEPTAHELTEYSMGWELSDKEDEIALLKAQLDLRQAIAVPLEATPQPTPKQDTSPSPEPLTTGDIAHCFDGLHWTESQWKKPLGDKPKWLAECVAIPGVRGVSETRWYPVLIGAALVQQGHAQARTVRAKFQTIDILKPWFEPWKSYEAEYFDNT